MVKKNVPKITRNQMAFMKSKKSLEKVEVNGVCVEIQPYMFPPESPYSYSTKVLLESMDLIGQRVLEIGVGCGILSIFAAKQGAFVDGVDVLRECVRFSSDNAKLNDVSDRTWFYYSDMFSDVVGEYDVIICNLPILNDDVPDEDFRWCSLFDPDFRAHEELFREGGGYASRIVMAHADLRGDGDFGELEGLAMKYGWSVSNVRKKVYGGHEWRNYEFELNDMKGGIKDYN